MARNQGAVQTREFNREEALRPQPAVRVVPVAALYKQPSTAMFDLAKLVGSVKRATGQYFDATEEAENSPEARQRKLLEEAHAKAQFFQLPEQEQQRLIGSGQGIPGIEADKLAADYGVANASRWLDQVPTFMQDFENARAEDPTLTRAAYLKQQRDAAAEQYEGVSRDLFVTATEVGLTKLNGNVVQADLQEQSVNRINQSADALRFTAKMMQADGREAPEIVSELFKELNVSARLKTLSNHEVNSVLMQTAHEAADAGNPDLVIALRDGVRVGKDGQKIQLGKIVAGGADGSQNYVDQFTRLLGTAEKNRVANDTLKNVALKDRIASMVEAGDDQGILNMSKDPKLQADVFGEDSEGYWKSLIATSALQASSNKRDIARKQMAVDAHNAGYGSVMSGAMEAFKGGNLNDYLASVEDMYVPSKTPGGEPVKVSKAEVERDAINFINQSLEQAAADKGWSDEDLIDAKLRAFTANGVVNPQWVQQFSGISSRASSAVVAKAGPQETAGLVQRAETYSKLYANAPGVLDTYVKNDQDKVFMEEYRLSRMSGASEQEALSVAANRVDQYVKNPKSFESISSTTISDYLSSSMDEFNGFWDRAWKGEPMTSFSPGDAAEFQSVAQWAMRNLKRDPDAAMDYAKEWMQKNYVPVNGKLVYTGDPKTPADFKVQAESYLKSIYDAHAEELGVDDPRDLILDRVSNGSGRWEVINATTGLPVTVDGKLASITFDGLRKQREEAFNAQLHKDWLKAKAEVDGKGYLAEAGEDRDDRVVPSDFQDRAPVSLDWEDPIDVVTRTVMGEAMGEGPTGWAAVAHVIQNRSKDKRFPKDVRDVALQPKQFSIWNNGRNSKHIGTKYPKDNPRYKRVREVVEQVMRGEIPDPTGGATFYLNPVTVMKERGSLPGWWPSVRRERGGDITIGNHRFTGIINK